MGLAVTHLVAASPFRTVLKANSPGKSKRCGCDGAVPNPDHGEVTPAATGERIVAFARPGKPPENGFSRTNERVPGNAGAANSWGFATVSKACRGRDVPTDVSIGSEKWLQ